MAESKVDNSSKGRWFAIFAWLFVVGLTSSIVIANFMPPVNEECFKIIGVAIVFGAAFGGAVPAKYFVGLLDSKVVQGGRRLEGSEKYTLKGRLSVLNLDATLEKGNKNPVEAEGGGFWIGVFERLAVVLCLIFAKESLFAVILAVKGLGRYSDIKSGAIESEKFIVGTFVSMLWAAGCAILISLLQS